ncbi:MAG: DEAD/DEAH box helicase [Brevundimonas sp.]|nr:DEAD/DEAH box helicase [Brevundimonas sp.]
MLAIESILDPILVVRRREGRYEITLEARRRSRGVLHAMTAPGLDFAWVHDGTYMYPLPNDVTEVVAGRLAGMEADDLTFPEVLALERGSDDQLQVVLDPSVFESGNVAAGRMDPNAAVPGLQATLFPYQAHGVAWMAETLQRTGGLILADEMGLGKTIQIIGAMLLAPPANTSPALVLCPTSLIANWVRELQRFAPSLTIVVHRGADRARLHRDLQRSQVVITTYDTAVNDLVLFRAVEWSWLVLDEAQAVKSPDSRRRVAVAAIPRQRTIPVTGTPVENHLLDLWSLADLAVPGLLGSRALFERRFPDTDDAARVLSQITAPIVLKRMVRDVAKDLPERRDVPVPIELGADLARRYDAVLEETLERYPAAGALVATGQLQLFCAHPWLRSPHGLAPDWEDRVEIARYSGQALVTPKIERTLQLLREAFAHGHKVLIFVNFNACAGILREAADSEGLPLAFWGTINGGTLGSDRQPIIDAFAAYEGPAVLILNPRAAGAGLNITAASLVIHYTQVWNPALEQQASARAHRRGQTQPVTIYHMYYVDTVEEVMMERAQRRREMGAEAVPKSGAESADLARALSMRPQQ